MIILVGIEDLQLVFLTNFRITFKIYVDHYFENLKQQYLSYYKMIPSHANFDYLDLNLFKSFGLPDFKAFFREFLLSSEYHYGLSTSQTTILLLGMHNLANSMKIFVNNELASFTLR